MYTCRVRYTDRQRPGILYRHTGARYTGRQGKDIHTAIGHVYSYKRARPVI
jgi:hypothetical protein